MMMKQLKATMIVPREKRQSLIKKGKYKHKLWPRLRRQRSKNITLSKEFRSSCATKESLTLNYVANKCLSPYSLGGKTSNKFSR
jgi:hypothetical protein